MQLRGAYRFDASYLAGAILQPTSSASSSLPSSLPLPRVLTCMVSNMLKDLEQQLEEIRKAEEWRNSLIEVPNTWTLVSGLTLSRMSGTK